MVKNLPALQETQVRSLGWEDPLEREVATHSSILAWKIPWTEKTGKLQSMELQKSQTGLSDWTKLNWVTWWLKEFTCNAAYAGDTSSIPGLGRSPRGGHGNLLQSSCLESPMDRGAWRVTVHRFAQNWTQLKRLSTHVRVSFYLIILLVIIGPVQIFPVCHALLKGHFSRSSQ